MDNLLLKAILVALVTWIVFADKYLTQFFTYRPIVLGPIIGLVMGNLRVGLEVGVMIELMFLGQVFVGTALPPEETFSTIIATGLAVVAGGSTEVAVATALPVAMLGLFAMQLRNMVLCVWTQRRLEAAVEKHNLASMKWNALVMPNVFNLFLFAIPAFLAIYFGAGAVQSIIDKIPPVIMQGLNVGGKMIGAVGLALLLKSISSKALWPFFFIGFVMAAYLKVNIIGITIMAVVFVALYYYLFVKKNAAENA